eukprot:214469-Rhodomonas_salina.2
MAGSTSAHSSMLIPGSSATEVSTRLSVAGARDHRRTEALDHSSRRLPARVAGTLGLVAAYPRSVPDIS